MTFPTIPTTGNGRLLSQNQNNTTATRTFPSLSSLTKNSGDLLIAIVVAYERSAAGATFGTWGGGFAELADVDGGATTMAVGIATKTSTGSETGTFSVTQAATVTGHCSLFLLSIPGWHGTTAPELTALAVGTAAAADPAALAPSWGAADTLWIAVGGNGETNTGGSWTGLGTPTPPTNYGSSNSPGIGTDAVGGIHSGVAFRQNNTSSEDSGTWSGQDVSNARNCALLIGIRPVGPTPVGLGLVTETETSQAVTRRWGVNAALVAEAERAQLTPSAWVDADTWADSMPWEHPTIEARKIVVLGQPSETETAQPVTLGAGGGQTINLGLVTETETAQPVTLAKTVATGQGTETETGQAVTVRKTVATGQPSELCAAQPLTTPKTLPLGLSAEAETAFTATVRRDVAAGQPVEIESAQPVSTGGQIVVPIGLVTETETARPVTLRKIVKLDDFYSEVYSEHYFSPVERESTQPLTLRKPLPLGLAAEAETAHTLNELRQLALGLASETETGQPVTFRWGVNLGQVTETETAQHISLGGALMVDLGLVTETEAALPVTLVIVIPWDPFEPVSSVGFDPFEPSAVPSVDPFEPSAGTPFDPFEPVS